MSSFAPNVSLFFARSEWNHDRPRVLNLPSADEITAMEHLDVLRLNGFDVEVDENAGVGERVKLTAQPVSRDTVFDVGGEQSHAEVAQIA